MVVDPARQTLARAYAYQRLGMRAISLLVGASALLMLGPLGGAVDLRAFVEERTGVWPLQVGLFFALLGLAWIVANAPLTYYRGFVLPHHYRMSNQTLGRWLVDLVKMLSIGTFLGAGAIEALYFLLRQTPSTWWIWAGIGYLLFALLLSALAPLLLLPLFFRLQPLRDPTLAGQVVQLADRAGARVSNVCEIDLSSKTPAANAAVIGLGKTRKIVLGDTLLREFAPDEIAVVVAHELGHHVHRDLGRGLAVESVLTVTGLAVSNVALHAAAGHWHFTGVSDLGAFPILAAALGLWNAASGIVVRAHSRRVEAAADAFSLSLTGAVEAFTTSEIRLTNQNLAWYRPPRWIEVLFYTHPAPWRRVAMGESYLGGAA